MAKRLKKPVIARINVITGKVVIEHGIIMGGRARHGYTDKDPTYHEVNFKHRSDYRWLPMSQIFIDLDSLFWSDAQHAQVGEKD